MTLALRNEEFRALQLYDHVPAAHKGVIVTDSDFEPHLHKGEMAIVDTMDQTTTFGEVYVLRMNMGSEPHLQHLAIVQLLREKFSEGRLLGLMYGFSLQGKGGLVFGGQRLRYVDGPLRVQYWPERCVGRIVGVLKPQWQGPFRSPSQVWP